MLRVDVGLFRWLNDSAGQSAVLGLIAFFLAKWLIFVMVGTVVAVGLRVFFGNATLRHRGDSARGLVIALRSSIASLGAVLDGLLISAYLFRERPFVALDGVHQLIADPLTMKSFPSDHATIAFAVAVSVLFLNRRWGLTLLACAVGVAVGRVLVGVHYPSDVVAGAALGAAWAAAVAVIGRHFGDERWLRRRLFAGNANSVKPPDLPAA